MAEISIRLPQKGGCQCGTVRYELTGLPIVFYLCHCSECQKQSSSAFGESLRVRAKDLKIEGDLAERERISPSGKSVVGQFCPKCGTRLFHRRAGYAENLNIKAGTLDDTSWLRPAGHIWTLSKQTWFQIGPDEISYERQPENDDDLTARWRQMIGAD
ncbi:MAG: GFA family protein [Hyphomicrobiaceae bacterium]|nr:GFA family protein [Hyphomicrobiaceae bacterium]MCC0024159.1 GFA family protein [Hyphomicrobiaceae bacterium]